MNGVGARTRAGADPVAAESAPGRDAPMPRAEPGGRSRVVPAPAVPTALAAAPPRHGRGTLPAVKVTLITSSSLIA